MTLPMQPGIYLTRRFGSELGAIQVDDLEDGRRYAMVLGDETPIDSADPYWNGVEFKGPLSWDNVTP